MRPNPTASYLAQRFGGGSASQVQHTFSLGQWPGWATLDMIVDRLVLGVVQWVARDEPDHRKKRMPFERQTAGRMMSLLFVQVHEAATTAEAIARLQAADPAEQVSILYLVDDSGRLIGIIPIGRLVKAGPGTPLRRLAQEPVISVTPDATQEEVARLALRHRVTSIAVVDRELRPIGFIRGGDLIQSIREGPPRNRSLRRRLERLIYRRPITRARWEVFYRLEASYVDTDAGYIRALMVRSMDAEKIRLRSFHSAKVGDAGGVQLRAELMAVSRNDRWIEQVAWRLSLEPGLKALRWQPVSQNREE